jgi:hypothetical protein
VVYNLVLGWRKQANNWDAPEATAQCVLGTTSRHFLNGRTNMMHILRCLITSSIFFCFFALVLSFAAQKATCQAGRGITPWCPVPTTCYSRIHLLVRFVGEAVCWWCNDVIMMGKRISSIGRGPSVFKAIFCQFYGKNRHRPILESSRFEFYFSVMQYYLDRLSL